jgi:hypothetical protein
MRWYHCNKLIESKRMFHLGIANTTTKDICFHAILYFHLTIKQNSPSNCAPPLSTFPRPTGLATQAFHLDTPFIEDNVNTINSCHVSVDYKIIFDSKPKLFVSTSILLYNYERVR